VAEVGRKRGEVEVRCPLCGRAAAFSREHPEELIAELGDRLPKHVLFGRKILCPDMFGGGATKEAVPERPGRREDEG
jgi:hypothetical protein